MSSRVADPRFSSIHNDPRFAKKRRRDEGGPGGPESASDPRFSSQPLRQNGTQKQQRSKNVTKAEKGPSKFAAGASVDSRFAAAASWQAEHAEDDEGMAASDSAPDADADYEAAMADAGAGDNDAGAAVAHEGGRGGAGRKGSSSRTETVEERLKRLDAMARGEYAFDAEDAVYTDDEDDEEAEGAPESDLDEDAYAEAVARDMDEESRIPVIDPDAPDLAETAAEHSTADGQETRRLALVNCDWDHLRAVDILVSVSSFLPATHGSVLRVDVYPSQYGLKKMREEKTLGPSRAIFKDTVGTKFQEEDDSVSANGSEASDTAADRESRRPSGNAPGHTAEHGAQAKRKSTGVIIGKQTKLSKSGGDTFDPAALRAYELNRLKYYIAVITCTSPGAAAHIYNTCDGMEFESSSNVFDLRFIPDDVRFDYAPARDSASHVPSDYTPPEFSTRALQSSKVELTWEGDDPQRTRALDWDKLAEKEKAGKKKKRRAGRRRDEDEEQSGGRKGDSMSDLKAYFASDSESEEEDEQEEEEQQNVAKGGKKSDAASVSASRMSRKEAKKADGARLRALLLGEKEEDAASNLPSDSEDDQALEEGSMGSAGGDDGDVAETTFVPGATKALREKTSALLSSRKGGRKGAKGSAGEDGEGETEGESLWEAYQRKKKAKKRAKKAAAKAAAQAIKEGRDPVAAAAAAEAEVLQAAGANNKVHLAGTDHAQAGKMKASRGAEDEDGDLEADSFFQVAAESSARAKRAEGKKDKAKSKGKGDRDVDEEDARMDHSAAAEKARLELLMVGEDTEEGAGGAGGDDSDEDGRNFNMQSLVKHRKTADKAAAALARQAKHGKSTKQDAMESSAMEISAAGAGTAGEDVTAAVASDPRFSAVFSSAEYSIDPTHPSFKATTGMRALVQERQKRTGEEKGSKKSKGEGRKLVVVKSDGVFSSAPTAEGSGADARQQAEALKRRFGGLNK